jgi:hypothetical protein
MIEMPKNPARITADAGKNERRLKAYLKLHQYAVEHQVNIADVLTDLIEKMDSPVVYERAKPTDEKIVQFVKETMKKNLEATEDYEKVAITVGYIRNNDVQKFNHHTATRFFNNPENVEWLRRHHEEVGIQDPTNWNKIQGRLKNAMKAEKAATA